MQRTITGYHQDEDGDWVGKLSCGHNQHLRHQPPFVVRPWVLHPVGRADHHGGEIDCPLCDRAELPEGLTPLGASPIWDEVSTPRGLRKSHRVALGRWGVIRVQEGSLRFSAQTTPPMQRVLTAGASQSVPPEVVHDVEPLGRVRFGIDWFSTSLESKLIAPEVTSKETEAPWTESSREAILRAGHI